MKIIKISFSKFIVALGNFVGERISERKMVGGALSENNLFTKPKNSSRIKGFLKKKSFSFSLGKRRCSRRGQGTETNLAKKIKPWKN